MSKLSKSNYANMNSIYNKSLMKGLLIIVGFLDIVYLLLYYIDICDNDYLKFILLILTVAIIYVITMCEYVDMLNSEAKDMLDLYSHIEERKEEGDDN